MKYVEDSIIFDARNCIEIICLYRLHKINKVEICRNVHEYFTLLILSDVINFLHPKCMRRLSRRAWSTCFTTRCKTSKFYIISIVFQNVKCSFFHLPILVIFVKHVYRISSLYRYIFLIKLKNCELKILYTNCNICQNYKKK